MTELKLGNKYECFNCGAKFYDLGKGAPVCPKCGADQKDAEEKENPLVTQSVRRRRKAELLPDDDSDAADGEEIAIPDEDEEIDDEELVVPPEDLETVEVEAEEEEEDDEV
jgi:predicted  nucleic acid-binding Zn-ribbon protein